MDICAGSHYPLEIQMLRNAVMEDSCRGCFTVNHVKLSERLLISPVPAPQLTRACVRALKIHELSEALLSCVTLLEIA